MEIVSETFDFMIQTPMNTSTLIDKREPTVDVSDDARQQARDDHNKKMLNETCYIIAESGAIKGIYENPLEMPPQYKWSYRNYAVPIRNGEIRLPSKIDGRVIDGVRDFWCMGGMKWKTASSKVKVMIIPDTYRFIGQKDFSSYQTLKTLYLPQNIELREFAFAYCSNLTKVYIGIKPGEEHNASIIDKEQAMLLFHNSWGIFDGCNESLQFYTI